MVPGIGVECVCLSGAMLAKAGTVLDVCREIEDQRERKMEKREMKREKERKKARKTERQRHTERHREFPFAPA